MERDRAVVLLAGGGGSRFAGPRHKLLAELPPSSGRAASTVFGRSLAIAWEAAIGPLFVVHGSLDSTAFTDDAVTIDTLARAARCDATRAIHFVRNDAWATGQASSLRVGIIAARRLDAAAVVVGLADQPGVTVDAWRTVAAGTGAIVVAVYDGRRGQTAQR